jgi:hypothetical protein
VSATVSPAGTSRCRRRTLTTACTAEQSQATSSAPLAPASSAALVPAESPAGATTGPTRGVNAASAAMSAAVCAAALATASAPMSTAATPASITNPVKANPMRVAPPRSPADQPHRSDPQRRRTSTGAPSGAGRARPALAAPATEWFIGR